MAWIQIISLIGREQTQSQENISCFFFLSFLVDIIENIDIFIFWR